MKYKIILIICFYWQSVSANDLAFESPLEKIIPPKIVVRIHSKNIRNEIHEMIERLKNGSDSAVQAMNSSRQRSDDAVSGATAATAAPVAPAAAPAAPAATAATRSS